MRIRKINDNKVQIIITKKDLEERDFNKGELMPLSPKTQKLFQDLLEMAYHECGFEIGEDSQLMVEAYPLSVDSIAVVMTKIKVVHEEEIGEDGLFPFWTGEEGEEDRGVYPGNIKGERQVWCFSDLENCIQACGRVVPDYVSQSVLYKYFAAYYLAVTTIPSCQEDVAAVLGEYGHWVPVDAAFFAEHAKMLIPREAIVNLVSLLK